ncbi:MAG: cupin domain-containing protein [Cyclobacteriaceae bacterium]|nr:cupin domain-containing protein [Cyclobacteriaceae bacterium]
MNRKQFLLAGLTISPMLAIGMPQGGKKGKKSATKPFVVDAEKSRFGDVVMFKGVNHNDLKISSKDTGGQLSVFEYRGVEKTGPSLHIHLYQDEIFTVTEGKFRFVVGDETHVLSEGQTIFLPRGIAHTWIQLTDTGKLIYFLQPAGKMEEFFITMNAMKTRPSDEEMDRIHAEHGMKTVGPPLTL